MRSCQFLFKSIIAALVMLFVECGSAPSSATGPVKRSTEFYYPEDFTTVKKYDTHVHINVMDTAMIHQARADNFRLLTVNVSPAYYPPLTKQQAIAHALIQRYPGRLAYATSFSLDHFDDAGWVKQSLDYLKQSFENGAIAVKIWKNIGMELKRKNGKFVMADDPKFDSIIAYLSDKKIPLLGHLGEPRNAWLALDKMTIKNDRDYYSKHPEYHMFRHPEYPSYEDQVRARDHLLEKYPDLMFIAAHLGSLEWSIDELSKRFERFPNMAVDVAARLTAIQLQAVTNRDKVRDFFIRYQDRLIYATDQQDADTTHPKELEKRIHERWLDDWNFLVGDSIMHSTAFDAPFRALQLPREVVDKVYRKNAENWFPGIDK